MHSLALLEASGTRVLYRKGTVVSFTTYYLFRKFRMWCATCDGHTVVGGICHFQTIAAAVLLAAAVAQGSWHVRRISLLQRVRYSPLTREKGEHLFQPHVRQLCGNPRAE